MPRFPHLDDNEFPYIRTVDVYQFQNEFDYSRWNENTNIRLCNVAWDSTYEDVVKFDNDSERDNYFDNIDTSYSVQLATAARVVPEGFVKLPIPYDIMAKFNYLVVDMPIATNETSPIDYENSSGKRRWYFFIDRIVYLAPSTTQVYLTLDVWTNFANDLDIRYMLLERGHAPVAAIDTDTYLENPMANNRYLLAPDVSFDEAGINASVTDVPFGNGKKYVCIASTCPPALVDEMGSAVRSAYYDDYSGTLSYSNTLDRYGYQLQVDGFTLGNGYDYSSARTIAAMGGSENGMLANNLTVYCIEARECYGALGTFFQDVVQSCPQFLNTVRGCFVVSEDCLVFGAEYRIAGHTVSLAIGSKETLLTKQLEKEDFGYPSEYERFAKLYTSPYAVLEITNNAGKTVRVNVEETSTLTVNALNSIAFPYVESLLYVDGIRGSGMAQYTWRDLRDVFLEMNMSHSDWFEFCFKMDIPTFALYMDGETAYALQNFNRTIKQGINDALVNYHNHVRSSNTAMENARDSADAAEQNTHDSALANKSASYNSADTGKANAYASAATAKTNTNDSANTAKQNSYNDADTAKQNADNNALAAKTNADSFALVNQTNAKNTAAATKSITDNTALTQRDNTTLEENLLVTSSQYEISTATSITSESVQTASANYQNANAVIDATTVAQNEVTVATANDNAVGNVLTSAIGGAVTYAPLAATIGASAGTAAAPGPGTLAGGAVGALGGAAIGTVSGLISAATSIANSSLIVGANATVATATKNQNALNTANNSRLAGEITRLQNVLKYDVVNAKNTTTDTIKAANYARSTDNSTISKTTTDTNADNSYNATIAADQTAYNAATTNATNSQTSKKTNADNTKAVTDANAARTETTSKANADRTEATSKANADLNYNAAIGNARRTCQTVYDNSGYTREVEILNAQETLDNAARSRTAALHDARNAQPIAFGSYTGDCAPDNFGYKGLQIKVKTQSISAIRQAGDYFARYGYALNQIWDVQQSGLNIMEHFTYWKASEVWLNVAVKGGNLVRDAFKRIFENGVTVWNDPAEIGVVSVYDN